MAIVKSVSDKGCEVDIDGIPRRCAIATHILGVSPGQRVAVLDGGPDAGCLVVAAWPTGGDGADFPLHFDPATGTLHIQSARLNLGALACIELQCGDAQLRMTLDGKVHIEGNDIVSAAMRSHRIEGASIDLN
ncbi:hypothetical protein OU994_28285 [Pseudoduganella sp. SL102]|uniref:hypothetical protein n=1 Tax=Pseudoduganella sp. SL102 TaxID=2995154 RepID=UPI00248B00DE|nr:hypothetical protein [Pseudoduganella sp. SL102]WBS02109.1 hypothetical protein OU994_28285 [Pseudoduganella sp. SL102]